MFPGRRALSQEFNVASPTIERAVRLLVNEGLLRTEDRRGTFVSYPFETAESEGDTSKPGSTRVNKQNACLGIIASYEQSWVGPSSLEHFVSSIVSTIELDFREHGARVTLHNLRRAEGAPFVSVLAAARALFDKGAAMLCVVDPHYLVLDSEIEEFVASGIASRATTVFVSVRELHAPIPHVMWDTGYAGFQAAHHLIDRGCRTLLFASPFGAPWVAERIAAARLAVAHADLPEDSLQVVVANPSAPVTPDVIMDSVLRFGRELVAAGKLSGGIIAANDFVAYGILDAAREAGIRPGLDFSIIGVDDGPLSLSYDLTTIRPPIEEMAKETIQLLNRCTQHIQTNPQVRLRGRILERSINAIDVSPAGMR